MRIFDIFNEKEGKYFTDTEEKTYFVIGCTAISSCEIEEGESARQEAVFVALVSEDSALSEEEYIYFNWTIRDLKTDESIKNMISNYPEDMESDYEVLETVKAL